MYIIDNYIMMVINFHFSQSPQRWPDAGRGLHTAFPVLLDSVYLTNEDFK